MSLSTAFSTAGARAMTSCNCDYPCTLMPMVLGHTDLKFAFASLVFLIYDILSSGKFRLQPRAANALHLHSRLMYTGRQPGIQSVCKKKQLCFVEPCSICKLPAQYSS